MVDLLGIISFFLLSLVVRKLVVGYLKDTNAGECSVIDLLGRSSRLLPTLLFDDEGVSRGARAPAAVSVVLPTIVIARSLRLESGGR